MARMVELLLEIKTEVVCSHDEKAKKRLLEQQRGLVIQCKDCTTDGQKLLRSAVDLGILQVYPPKLKQRNLRVCALCN